MQDFTDLDNPIWFALTTAHQPLAQSKGLARRYPSDVSPLAGLAEPSAAAFADLAALVGPDERVALFTPDSIEVPGDWQVILTRPLDQMICTRAIELPAIPLQPLRPPDVPDMLALTAATEPGPFLTRTIEMGRYFGIRSDGCLAAMAGERLKLNAFTEVSAVCTDPAFRGSGHGRALVNFVAAQILGENRTPFLHVKGENIAKVLYTKVGFSVRRAICLTVIGRRPTV